MGCSKCLLLNLTFLVCWCVISFWRSQSSNERPVVLRTQHSAIQSRSRSYLALLDGVRLSLFSTSIRLLLSLILPLREVFIVTCRLMSLRSFFFFFLRLMLFHITLCAFKILGVLTVLVQSFNLFCSWTKWSLSFLVNWISPWWNFGYRLFLFLIFQYYTFINDWAIIYNIFEDTFINFRVIGIVK